MRLPKPVFACAAAMLAASVAISGCSKKSGTTGSSSGGAKKLTIAFVPKRQTPAELVGALAGAGMMTGSGHFYSVRLCEALGIDPQRGVARISLAHYNTPAEVDRLLYALDRALSA